MALLAFNRVFAEILEAELAERLTKNAKAKRTELANSIMLRFADTRKLAIPNLDKRLDDMKKRVTKMCDRLEIKLAVNRLLVRVAGSDESTLRMLRLGTRWFDAIDDIEDFILAVVLSDTK